VTTRPTEATDPIVPWLLDRATRERPFDEIVAGLASQLGARGVALFRLATSMPTKHPEVFVRYFGWSAGGGTATWIRARELLGSPSYRDSPVAAIHRGEEKIRRRLAGDGASLDYPICRELHEQGATDYVALALDLGRGARTYVSFATARPEGFADEEIALFERLVPALEVVVAAEAAHFALRSLLDVYLGPNAAARVLLGAFERGRGERIRAAIWYCDMRGFTRMADQAPPEEVVATLDAFFEALGEPITSRGGEILKFIGDAALAIFPAGEDPRAACRRALDAALDARAAVERLASAGPRRIELGIALHLGEVMYGNIGARERLDFTVIGAAVNEVCRVESLCKTLGESVLLTAAFARAADDPRARSLGRHPLRGVSEPAELFALSPDP
jgi:adenylate cyclase